MNNEKIVLIAATTLTGIYLMTATQKTSTAGRNAIKRYEALRLKPYKDTGGKWTIGYGHLISNNEEYLLDKIGISRDKANALFENDVKWAEKNVKDQVKIPLTSNEFDSLVSFVFNVGSNAFKNSTLLKLLNNNNKMAAANQFKRWKYVDNEINSGLFKRREHERNTFLS